MKKNYISAQLEIMELELNDIVTASDEIKVLPKSSGSGDYSTNDPGFLKFFIVE